MSNFGFTYEPYLNHGDQSGLPGATLHVLHGFARGDERGRFEAFCDLHGVEYDREDYPMFDEGEPAAYYNIGTYDPKQAVLFKLTWGGDA